MQELIKKIRKFVEERDWEQFHSPKNLSMALSVEVAELQEHFLWHTTKESNKVDSDKLENIKNEVGDTIIYLLRFCDVLGIDPLDAANEKLRINAEKYPIASAKGSPLKYTEHQK